jgi:hypothetical protein
LALREEEKGSCAHIYGLRSEEVGLDFPCDRFLPDVDDCYYRAIDVAAPPAILFRWLCQLRVAPYSYDWLDNFGHRSPRRLTPGLERLAVDQRFMTIFDLVEFEPDVHITLSCTRLRRVFGSVAVTYLIEPREQGCRLLVKIVVNHPGPRLEFALRARLLPFADLVMTRKQLRTLRELAQCEHDA